MNWSIRLATLFFIAFLFMVLAYVERMTAEKLVIDRPNTHGDSERRSPIFVIPRILGFPDGLRARLSPLVFLIAPDARPLAAVLVLFLFSAIGYSATRDGRSG